MTSRERVIRTLQHLPVDRAPRELWALAGIRFFRTEEMNQMLERYPCDFAGVEFSYGKAEREVGSEGYVGSYVDAWGCVWHVAEPGVAGEVKESPLEDWAALASYKLPWEQLREADFSNVNRSVAGTDLFTKAGSLVRLFERMQFLRGTENLFIDLAYGTKEVYKLLEMLHDFFRTELEMWARTDVEAVSFMDDWGSQTALLISPAMWRGIFKPLYKDYCDILHGAGKYVFFHSDGFISDIYPDLIEIGVDAINSQLFCMDIESLGEKYAGKITFWGEIDRQHVLPFGSTEEVRDAVRRVRKALDRGNGGVIAQCEWGVGTPSENIAAVFDEWDKVR